MRNSVNEPRPWVKKFENGEYLTKWKSYDNILIGGPYSQSLGIGEEKFNRCFGFFCGIGDVSWWISSELDDLTESEEAELEWICKYKTYIKKEVLTHENISIISKFYYCESFHVSRVGDKQILELLISISEFHKKIKNSSKNCRDDKTLQFNNNYNPLVILSFEEYKFSNVL